jgi:2-(1,2-epoxy-1,2-dihydrophenyl)acetyl-CoA isomerase
MTAFGNVGVELVGDHVAVVELRRPPNNYFDLALLGSLADALEHLAAADLRAVVLCADGRHFCAGADLASAPSAGDRHVYDEALRLFEQPLPVVAAMQGGAIGGGLGLALVADRRVMGETAWCTANFARLGFHHGFALTLTLPRLVGHQSASDLLFTGRRVDAAEAERIGLCDAVVADDTLRDAALEQALTIAASAPLAVASIRTTLRADLVANVRGALAHERAEQERLQTTADWREGVSAAAERRTPRFLGR